MRLDETELEEDGPPADVRPQAGEVIGVTGGRPRSAHHPEVSVEGVELEAQTVGQPIVGLSYVVRAARRGASDLPCCGHRTIERGFGMSPVGIVVVTIGTAYVLAGLLGLLGAPFVSGTGHGTMPSSDGDLFGIFPINAPHNILHLAVGGVLLFGAAGGRAALVARIVGGTYAAVGLLGFAFPDTFGLMPIGGPAIALHLATAAFLLGVTLVDHSARALRA